MTIQDVRDALLSVLPGRVYHYLAPTDAADSREAYAVWGETGIDPFDADDGFTEWAVSGMIYFYTSEEYDGRFDALCAALDSVGISLRPGRIAYDDATAQTAYELTWSVACEPGAMYAEEDGG